MTAPRCGWESYLTPDSVVFEIGAYEGAWVKKIAHTEATIYAFEPSLTSLVRTQKNIAGIANVHLLNYGLGSRNEKLTLYNDNCDGATFIPRNGKRASAQIRDVLGVVKELSVARIDVCRVNIEGGEYELLPRMFSSGVIDMVHYLMIQWHYLRKEDPALHIEINRQIEKRFCFVRDFDLAAWNIWEQLIT